MSNSKAPMPVFSLWQRLHLFCHGLNWNIPTYTTANELFRLMELARGLKEKSIAVEIGSYIGASSLMIARGLPKNSRLVCIDTWQNDAMTEGNWDSFEVFKKNTSKVSHKIDPWRMTSVEAGKVFNEEIDFVFIDGDHSYEGVKQDVEIWFPRLKSGGIIAMHDIEWAEGVKRVVVEDVMPNIAREGRLPNLFWGWKK